MAGSSNPSLGAGAYALSVSAFFLFYGALALLALDLLRLSPRMGRALTITAALVVAAGVTGYGLWNAYEMDVVEVEVPVAAMMVEETLAEENVAV